MINAALRKRNVVPAREAKKDLPVRLSTLFRSETYPSGATRRVGNMHMHLDCSQSETLENKMIDVAKVLEGHGWPSKVSRVNYAKPGTHLSHPEYAEEYLQHTPELCSGGDTFAAYLTTLLAPEVKAPERVALLRQQAREVMARYAQEFVEADGVIEIERVVALIDPDSIQVAEPAIIPKRDESERTLFEVHHFVDFSHNVSVDFDEWQALCNLSGIAVGGWFQFDKKDAKALRSVKFAKAPDVFQLIGETRELASFVRESLDIAKEDMHVQTVVEQIIDIWRV